eukprot:g9570.t1
MIGATDGAPEGKTALSRAESGISSASSAGQWLCLCDFCLHSYQPVQYLCLCDVVLHSCRRRRGVRGFLSLGLGRLRGVGRDQVQKLRTAQASTLLVAITKTLV